MKIKLFNSNKEVIIDDCDSDLSKFEWRVSPDGYARTTINGKRWYIHRYIMKPEDNLEIDHKNGNRLDNRRKNLRICTRRENVRNSKKGKKQMLSKYKGVTYCTTENRIKRWRAACEIDGKLIYFGRYHTEKEAALAYNKNIKKLFGEFAKYNKIK